MRVLEETEGLGGYGGGESSRHGSNWGELETLQKAVWERERESVSVCERERGREIVWNVVDSVWGSGFGVSSEGVKYSKCTETTSSLNVSSS